VLLVLPDYLTPPIVHVFDLVDNIPFAHVRVVATADGFHPAEVVVSRADSQDCVIHDAAFAEVGHAVVGKPAGGVVNVGVRDAPLLRGAGRAAEPVVAGRNVVAVVVGEGPHLGGLVLRKLVIAVGVDGGSLPGGVDGGGVEVLGGLRLNAVAGAFGVVGRHGHESAAGVVLVIDGHVLVGVGLVYVAVVVVLDAAYGASGVVELGLDDPAEVVDGAIGPPRGVVLGKLELEVDAGQRVGVLRVRLRRCILGNIRDVVGVCVDQRAGRAVEEVVRQSGVHVLAPVVGRGHDPAQPVVPDHRGSGVAVGRRQHAGRTRVVGQTLVRGRGHRLAGLIVPGLPLFDHRVAGHVVGIGVGRFIRIVGGVRRQQPSEAVVGVFLEQPVAGGRFHDVTPRVVPGLAGEVVARRAVVGIDLVDPRPVDTPQGVIEAIGLGAEFASGEREVVAGVGLGPNGVAQVVVHVVRHHVGRAQYVGQPITPVVLVGRRIVVIRARAEVLTRFAQVAIGVEAGTGDLDHVVALGGAAGGVGVRGPGVVGAHPGLEHVSAGVIDHTGDGSIRRDRAVLPAHFARLAEVLVAVSRLLVVGARRAGAGGGDVVVHPRRDQPGLAVLMGGPGGVVGLGDRGRGQVVQIAGVGRLDFLGGAPVAVGLGDRDRADDRLRIGAGHQCVALGGAGFVGRVVVEGPSGRAHAGWRATDVGGVRRAEGLGDPTEGVELVIRRGVGAAGGRQGPAGGDIQLQLVGRGVVDVLDGLRESAGERTVFVVGDAPKLVHRPGETAVVVEPLLAGGAGARAVLAGGDRRQGRRLLLDLERAGIPRVGVGGGDCPGAVVVLVHRLATLRVDRHVADRAGVVFIGGLQDRAA